MKFFIKRDYNLDRTERIFFSILPASDFIFVPQYVFAVMFSLMVHSVGLHVRSESCILQSRLKFQRCFVHLTSQVMASAGQHRE